MFAKIQKLYHWGHASKQQGCHFDFMVFWCMKIHVKGKQIDDCFCQEFGNNDVCICKTHASYH